MRRMEALPRVGQPTRGGVGVRPLAELAVEQKAHEKSRIELQRERANRRDIDHQLERSTARGVQLDIELSAARRMLGDVEPKLARATEALATAEAALGKADATARLVEARLELARTDAAQPGNDARTAPLSVAPAFNRAAVVDAMAKAARAGREMAAAFEAIADVVGVDAIKLNGTDETAKTTPIGIRQRRRAMTPLPGGVGAGSREAAEHLMRVKGVELLIDGYNLAKRVWPDAILEEQRRLAIDLSDEVGARMRHTVIVVFDGAAVSSPASGRRWVSVRFSEAGMIADDLIVEIVASIPLHRPVVVVTDDAELRERTSALGASAIRLDSFLTAARRSLN